MLLILMFFVAMLTFSMMATLPRVIQEVKRDREEEMIHRGTEYARAVKKFYKKLNRYPNDLKELEGTNNIRFIRRRYKDPMSKDGNWKLLHITDVQQGISNPNFGVSQAGNFNPTQGGPGQPGGAPFGGAPSIGGNGQGGFSLGNSNPQNPSPDNSQAGGSSSGGTTAAGGDTSSGSSNGSPQVITGFSTTGGTSTPGSPATGGQTGQTYGAGGIVGVESMSKAKSIREFGGKSNYNKWMFIYDPTQDRGTLLRGPYNPQAFQGANNVNGANGQQPGVTPGTGFGNTFGQPSGGQQQNNNGPGQQMPPDQNAPPQ